MKLEDKVIVVTGGAHGIGRALCERFALEKPRGIVVADIDVHASTEVADAVGGRAIECDVSREADIRSLVKSTEEAVGPIDLFCSNAGMSLAGDVDTSDDDWRTIIDVNFMSHVWAARAVLPSMVARGRGYLLQTASAAGLVTEIGSAPYAVTKHAAVALAEWLAIRHAHDGIKVSCLCPMGVRTRMIEGDHPVLRRLRDHAVTPEKVADDVVHAIDEERFLVLPHPEVAEFMRRKADDYDRWLDGMVRMRDEVMGDHLS